MDMTPELHIYESQDGPCALVSKLPLYVGNEVTRQARQVEHAKRLVLEHLHAVAIRYTSVAASESVYVWFRR